MFFPFLFGERDIFFGNGIEAPFMLFYFNLLSFFKGNFFCLCQYVHYKVDYSDVELNKEEKEKDKRKEEKVCLVYHFAHWLSYH